MSDRKRCSSCKVEKSIVEFVPPRATCKRQHKPIKKNGPGVKNNNKGQMAAFECKGWLHITVFKDIEEAHINFRHKDQHVHYYRIDIPEDVKKYVADNVAMRPGQLWTAILEKFGQPRFSRSSLYAFWSSLSNSDWRCDDDELKSAKILIKEASQLQHSAESNKQIYEVESITLPDDPSDGFTAIAFSLVPLLRQWHGTIREISLDSAWNTNKSRFEIFALLGEVYGSGCPLGYLLIQSSPNHAEWEDGKQRYLEALLSYFHKKWSPWVVVTLTDKDRAEINAFCHCFPEAKHQLCFWHCLPHYNPINAKADFSFVDPDFVPISQLTSQQVASADMYVAQSAIPQLTICLGGVLQNQVPPQLPKLILRINGEAVCSYQEKVKAGNNSLPTSLNLDSELDDPDLADNDLSEAVEQMDTETDQEDGPDWMFEAGETLSRDPNYIFCPASHRKQLLHLFTKHFCLHPFFRSRGGLTLSAKQIQLNSAHEMYKFCKDRGLHEVWAYMYNCWYCPTMWKLWARSSSPYLSRLRTTMNVENFWKQLKHEQLHHLLHPRLDQLVHILIYKVTPMYVACTNFLTPEARLGCSRPPTPFQKAFKKNWNALLAKKIDPASIQKYSADVKTWSCNCGAQMFNSHHLCKHLVHAVGLPSAQFWTQVSCRRVKPLYQHVDLQGDTNDSGSITDGDDSIWTGDKSVLRGGGQWKDIYRNSVILGKRSHANTNKSTESNHPEPDSPTSPAHSRLRFSNRDIDLPTPGGLSASLIQDDISCLDVPIEDNVLFESGFIEPGSPAMLPGPDSDGDLESLSSSRATMPSNYEEDEVNDETKIAVDTMLNRAAAWKAAADRVEKQARYIGDNAVWFKSLARQDIGRDVEDLESNIFKLENAQRRKTTWGSGRTVEGRPATKREEARRVANTMGYQVNAEDGGEK
ncbi:hypothetical protein PQX77_014179 [Marasmius sp. AFHP31]|nr:hypothetical protein PQX77_014179 [Marasmius sp. AFHP31]